MDDLENVNETSLLKQRRFLHSLTKSETAISVKDDN